jgi:hypothetical protein
MSNNPALQSPNDNLGTLRINADRDGNVVSRSDYMPDGEEIIALRGRSNTNKRVADDVRQGFTGYENDDETGLWKILVSENTGVKILVSGLRLSHI